jgi:hydrogenase maturation factor
MPAKVIECRADVAAVDIAGRVTEVSILAVPNLSPGDWVRVLAGIAVERLDPAVAHQIQKSVLIARTQATGGQP